MASERRQASVWDPYARVDADGQTLDSSQHTYTLTFPPGQQPPVNAFWSLTMYDGKTQLLIENPINRYLVNSPMLSAMKTNADGSLRLYIQNKSPGPDKEANWLPAPNGHAALLAEDYAAFDPASRRRDVAASGCEARCIARCITPASALLGHAPGHWRGRLQFLRCSAT